jgi:CDP-diacylglycerol--glycerol-3-phosphate 3-phosphatidyltransferase
VNLPNAITLGRILAAPFVAWLPFASSWSLRLAGFLLFVVVAVSDYYDGMLARTRNLVTNLGKQLDPLADKLFLVATFVPMYVLMEQREPSPMASIGMTDRTAVRSDVFPPQPLEVPNAFPFVTPFGEIGFPVWIAIIILGRELFMTIFRQLAAKRGVVIAAIGPAKWKTGFQLTWVGAAYFWFWMATAASRFDWWRGAATILTMYSLVLYVKRYGRVFSTRRERV